MLVSLLQPAPESYNLFDDVMLIAEGEIASCALPPYIVPSFNV